MPWCPNCKTEYRDGITTCIDCGADLVEELQRVPVEKQEVFSHPMQEKVDKFLKYLTYCGIESGEKVFDEEAEYYKAVVDKEDLKEAKNHFRAFFLIESTEALTEESFDGLSQEELERVLEDAELAVSMGRIPKSELPLTAEQVKAIKADKLGDSLRNDASHTYVKKGDQYKDYMFSAYTFLLFGVFGLLFIILNMVGVIHMMTIPFTQIIMLVVFALFLIIGFSTLNKAKHVKSLVADEESLTLQITNYMKDTFTPDWMAACISSETSEELIYFEQEKAMKEDMKEQYPDLDNSYIEALIEDFFNQQDSE